MYFYYNVTRVKLSTYLYFLTSVKLFTNKYEIISQEAVFPKNKKLL